MRPRHAHLGVHDLDSLAEGMSEAEILAEYPQLATEDIRAAIAYG